MALTLIKGEKVDLWVKNMLDSLRRLHPVQHNVPAVWNHFEEAFRTKFTDSTRELQARGQLERLKFRYPDIDGYIAEFEDLTVQAGYNIASQETINLFLKGFNRNRNLLDKVFTPPVPITYEAMKGRLIAIVKSMQLVNSITQDAPDFRTFRTNPTQMPRGNQPNRGFAPRQVTSSNAPQWMNNSPVPMDTSNRAHARTDHHASVTIAIKSAIWRLNAEPRRKQRSTTSSMNQKRCYGAAPT